MRRYQPQRALSKYPKNLAPSNLRDVLHIWQAFEVRILSPEDATYELSRRVDDAIREWQPMLDADLAGGQR